MKRKIKDQLLSLTVAELKKKVTELRKSIIEEKMKRYSTPGKNVRVAKELRIQLAVAQTALTAKLFGEGK
ncbi:MAG: hypothetical protein AAB937_01205 [Patescibacteria group bacterium]